jgi:GDPmannose 4,6-dehydratase
MVKRALITGVSGQDGSYLSEYLLTKGYEVFGIVRRNSTPENQISRIDNLPVKTFYGDMTDQASLERVLREVQPTEIYNLAAQSHVRISYDIAQYTVQTNALGVLNLLEAYRHICPEAKFYQASSSEMFGNSVDLDGFQRETTPMHPVSPYGCAKLFAYHITRNYRRSYGLKISNGILFNHESPKRGSNFVTNKVVKAAVRIKYGLQHDIELGNINTFRDWGHSKDYVRAMHLILQQDPSDWVVATGRTQSVENMLLYVSKKLGIDIPVRIKEELKRPDELVFLKGDCSRIRELGWQPVYTFEMLMDEMIDFWLKEYE